MSLIRYENSDVIIQLSDPQYGQVLLDSDLRLLPHQYLIPDDPNIVKNTLTQIHIYSFYGDYIAGSHDGQYIIHDVHTNSLLLDIAETFQGANIRRGSYIIVANIHQPIWGYFDNPTVYLREISPDRTELKLSIPSNLVNTVDYQNFIDTVSEMKSLNIFNNLVIDFGYNRIGKILLFRVDVDDPGTIYIKLYKAIDDDVVDKDVAWFATELMDSYVDTVILSTPITPSISTHLRGANYDIDVDQWTSNSTIFKTWDDLLDSDAITSQRVIDMSISGSSTARLNIDYTDFNNYVFYSSATERLGNFRYKLTKLEEYADNIQALQESTASSTVFISSSIATNTRRIDQVTSAFDHWERWLYYDSTGSLFTHDVSGSITPFPKYLDGGVYKLHPVSSSIATDWYTHVSGVATEYDQLNYNRLWWSIPEHVVMDAANSDYVLFVEMVAQHFDNLYVYVKAMSDIHTSDEHPQRGISNDLLWHKAKSFGWNLQNTRQLSDLWFYKVGMNQTGQMDTGSFDLSASGENQTHQIWRRIVNNLPYLLKTKGTGRSVKALMSIYGIPQTLISIKEYGGPSKRQDRPQWIEDRFSYKLNLDGNSVVEIPRRKQPPSSGSWGGVERMPDTIEFRFSTDHSGSGAMSLYAWELSSNRLQTTLNLSIEPSSVFATPVYSGSLTYGRLTLAITNDDGWIVSGSTSPLPLFDGDMWTVQLYATESVLVPSGVHVRIGRASDCANGQVHHTSSLYVEAPPPFLPTGQYSESWGVEPNPFDPTGVPMYAMLGGSTGSFTLTTGLPRFIGSVQGYKEYFEVISENTFIDHCQNPGAYNGNNVTSSFHTLHKYYPLGLDVQRSDHTQVLYISSSHPNQLASGDTIARMVGFTGDQSSQYTPFRETHYIYTPSLGGNNIRNNKIRLEESKLSRDLTANSRVEKSYYDKAPVDTNRLAIVFSMADQVNRDIFNQFGFDELDDWIADPEYEFVSEYSELKRFSSEYYKKYRQRNDINAFIRLLSIYDYTFFEQIRQLVPGRADLIAGILIEPNILERSKVRLSKRPTIENPQWDETIRVQYAPPIGEYILYETSASATPELDFEYQYYTGSVEYEWDVDFEYQYYTGSIYDPFDICISSIHHVDVHHQNTGICGVIRFTHLDYSGSQSHTQSIVDTPRRIHECKYYRVDYHYSASGIFPTRYLRQWYSAVSKSYGMHYSRSLHPIGYQIDECGGRNKSRFIGSKMTSAWFNVDSPDTVDGGPVVTIIERNPNNLYSRGTGGDGNLFVQ